MLGLFALENRAMAGSVYQMLNHGISTGMLFLLVGVIYERRHTRLISEFGGLAKVMPAYAAVFVIVTLSSIGLPTTNGFVGEFLILWGTFKSQVLPHPRWMTMLAATGVILGAVYMLSVVLRMFFGSLKNPRNRDLQDLSAREWLYLLPGIVLIFVMGLFPTPFLKKIEPSVELMRMDYLKKGAASLTIDEPVLGRPVTWLLPADRRPLPIAPKPRLLERGPGRSITKLTPGQPMQPGNKIKGYRKGAPLPTGHRPNLPKVPPHVPQGGPAAKGGAR
jgi:NADH-quinone oxidoreductase subunit M